VYVFSRERRDRGRQVIAHQVKDCTQKLVSAVTLRELAVDRVNSCFSRGHSKDQPAFADINAGQLEDIAKEGAVRLGVPAVEQEMSADNHAGKYSPNRWVNEEFCVDGNLRTANLGYPDCMDHLEVLRDKVAGLRAEIAEIQRQNQEYRLRGFNGTEAQVTHGERQERLLAIQEELAKVGDLGRRVISVERMKEQTRSRSHSVPQEKAS
jgi:hypothetical protein